MSKIASPELMHFSTDALPERDRIAIWREVFGRRIVKAEFEVLPNARFFHETIFRNLNGLSLISSTAMGFRATRAQQQVRDGNDDLFLTVNTGGVAFSSQFGREMRLGLHEGQMLLAAEPSQFSVPGSAKLVTVAVPRKVISAMVKDPEAAAARQLRKDMEPLRLLTSYLSAADVSFTFTDPRIRRAFITHVYDLVALALGATPDATELAQNRGLRAARLDAIKATIVARLSDERLSVTDIADRHRLTARYVQMLFEAEGTTFSEYLLEQRLAHAHRLLINSRYADHAISAIAYDLGFANLSYFNRTFRRRFDNTPSDVREQARRK